MQALENISDFWEKTLQMYLRQVERNGTVTARRVGREVGEEDKDESQGTPLLVLEMKGM